MKPASPPTLRKGERRTTSATQTSGARGLHLCAVHADQELLALLLPLQSHLEVQGSTCRRERESCACSCACHACACGPLRQTRRRPDESLSERRDDGGRADDDTDDRLLSGCTDDKDSCASAGEEKQGETERRTECEQTQSSRGEASGTREELCTPHRLSLHPRVRLQHLERSNHSSPALTDRQPERWLV